MNTPEMQFQRETLIRKLTEVTLENDLLRQEVSAMRSAYKELSQECSELRLRLGDIVISERRVPKVGDKVVLPKGHVSKSILGSINELIDDGAIINVNDKRYYLKYQDLEIETKTDGL